MFCIKIAGIVVRIDNKYPLTEKICKDYISETESYDFSVCASDAEISSEIIAAYELYGRKISMPYAESSCIYRRICLALPSFDAFVFHASAVEYDKKRICSAHRAESESPLTQISGSSISAREHALLTEISPCFVCLTANCMSAVHLGAEKRALAQTVFPRFTPCASLKEVRKTKYSVSTPPRRSSALHVRYLSPTQSAVSTHFSPYLKKCSRKHPHTFCVAIFRTKR